MLIDIVVIGILISANGFFAAAEMALVTARKTRLKALANSGDQRAKKALAVQEKPGDYLAAVQIGVTLVGTAASALGGARIVDNLSPFIARYDVLGPYAESIVLGLVIIVLSYVTLVFGELAPKRLALRNADAVALALAGPLEIFSRLAKLPLRVLSFSTEAVLKLFGNATSQSPTTSPEEIELLVKQGAVEGVIKSVEERLIRNVFDYSERQLRDVMTPRTAMVAFDVETPTSVALELARKSGFSRFPVYHGNLDNVVGYVHFKDMVWSPGEADLRQLLRQVHFIPGSASLPEAFDVLAKPGGHLAIVLDEYGGTLGLLTLEDLLEEIVGEIEDEHSPVTRSLERHADREWILEGTTLIAEVEELLGVGFDPQGMYVTLAGFILTSLGKIPAPGDQVVHSGYVFTVKEMDRMRIASVHVQPVGNQ